MDCFAARPFERIRRMQDRYRGSLELVLSD